MNQKKIAPLIFIIVALVVFGIIITRFGFFKKIDSGFGLISMSKITVYFRESSAGGPQIESSPTRPLPHPVSNVTIQVVSAKDPNTILDSKTTDSQGKTEFYLPAGDYLVIAPRDNNNNAIVHGSTGRSLPNNELVWDFSEIQVIPNKTQEINLFTVFEAP